ncbi:MULTISPECIES: heavy-metal-associated domain-containing protein [unclassified Algibacter]|uniref:heavy-metal-associated domain-containing protein n=1 Tax=unclassified Algibacter TaxID=2615009 RepID=UPI00131D1C21|nr:MULTISPECIES: heavy-metal-associated domain-containing protein [unclassified Algibacter]MCL5129073.1 heavy-metal-associated domain-containing protein [Algibacter sp. L4_22]
MKKLLIIALLVTTTLTFSQNKNERASIEVDGVCTMCKARIEKAAIRTKGVKSAVWSVKTHELSLIYDARKTNLDSIKSHVLGVGHDIMELKATDEAYATVHPCCRYRDNDVIDEHKDEKEDSDHDEDKH